MNRLPPGIQVRALLLGSIALMLLVFAPSVTFGGSARWSFAPNTSDWNTASNWDQNTVPNGVSDIATFDVSVQSPSTTAVSISANTQVSGIVFDTDPFMITASPTFTLTISGAGITNNSGITQNFVSATSGANRGTITFTNSASTGSNTAFENHGALTTGAQGGLTQFLSTSSAGSAAITNDAGATNNAGGGVTSFHGSSTAGNATITNIGASFTGASEGQSTFLNTSSAGSATITNNAGATNSAVGGLTTFGDTSTAASAAITASGASVNGASGGDVSFISSATAANATITANGATVTGAGSGAIFFSNTSTAGAADLIANGGTNGGLGGTIVFRDSSTGGTAHVQVFGNGSMDISNNAAGGVTVATIEGSGNIFLGSNKLTLNYSPGGGLPQTFSGVIQDGGLSHTSGGSLTKTGNSRLILTGNNLYTGGTTVTDGILYVNNSIGSGTGSGPVNVAGNRFTLSQFPQLSGSGTIFGPVTIGDSNLNDTATLEPVTTSGPSTLTIQSTLTFKMNGFYAFALNSSTLAASEVIANGVTIDSHAAFDPFDLAHATLPTGTVLIAIDNTSNSAISGTFGNLPDGSTITVNSNMFLVNYEGGNGNDLTLTVEVVPEPSTCLAGLLSAGAILLFLLHNRRNKRVGA